METNTKTLQTTLYIIEPKCEISIDGEVELIVNLNKTTSERNGTPIPRKFL